MQTKQALGCTLGTQNASRGRCWAMAGPIEFTAWIPIWTLQILHVEVASGKGNQNHFIGVWLQVSTA